MNYYEVKFHISPLTSDASDLLAALAGEAGFETFEQSADGLTGYVQQPLFDQSALDAALQQFPLPHVTISYTISQADQRDWNEAWEQQGFEPIMVGHRLVIHDGRHLPSSSAATAIEIDARMAFGTGTHETTQMVCATLLDLYDDPLDRPGRVLDCGCGTGILGIAAMKLGASECIAYDIDEWSVDNTRHNAVINHVEVTPLLGDSGVLQTVEGTFNLVMANINRNILLSDMPLFRQKMAPGGWLILSGFYTCDIPMLTKKAVMLGLSMTAQREANKWACIVLRDSD